MYCVSYTYHFNHLRSITVLFVFLVGIVQQLACLFFLYLYKFIHRYVYVTCQAKTRLNAQFLILTKTITNMNHKRLMNFQLFIYQVSTMTHLHGDTLEIVKRASSPEFLLSKADQVSFSHFHSRNVTQEINDIN